ncbi:MAG: NAD(P)H-hydrate epimerase [Actinobacteria bacterium]|nr:NAD(P)H-hydrate epimerase [Actinomycetota bacterium]
MDPRLEPERFWARLRSALEQVDDRAKSPPPDARVGAVLVLLEDSEAGPVVVLTRRRPDLGSHPGQISFAGGRLDPDETIEQAALREADEEIGLDADSVEVVGVGPRFYIPPSRFWVVPVLARWRAPHELNPNPWEVDAILRVPLAQLLDRSTWRTVTLSDQRARTWAWQLDDDLLWGATAIVMALLLEAAVEDWSGGTRPEDLDDERVVRPWEHAPTWQRKARLDGVPEVDSAGMTHVTAEQMREVDRHLAAVGVPLASLAEHAGRGLAEATRGLLGRVDGRLVTVLAGSGGNGAGGLVAARLLAGYGASVVVRLTGEPVLADQVEALRLAGIDVADFDRPANAGDAVVDAMLGYGAEPGLRDLVADAVGWLQRHDVRVVSNDLPSGMLADGLHGLCVTADITVTVAAPKVGFRDPITHPFLGDLYLADIGVPRGVWEQLGLEPVEVFHHGPLVRLVRDQRGGDAGTPEQGTYG